MASLPMRLFTAGARRAAARTAILTLVASRAAAQTAAQPPRFDRQLRPEISLTIPAAARWDLVAGGQVQVGEYEGRVIQNRVGIAAQYRAARFLTLAPGYQYLSHRQAGGVAAEHRPTATANLRLALPHGVILSDRNLVEVRFRSGTRSARYRNRVTLEHALGGGRIFLSDEVFFDSRYREWVRNQLAVGVAGALTARLSCDLYLMRQDDGRARPGDLLILGTILRARL